MLGNNFCVQHVLDLTPPAFILNLTSWTRRLFDTRSLLELYIHEAMGSLLIFTDIKRSVISAAYYTSNKYFRGLFR